MSTPEEIQDLASEYVLGTLSAARRSEVAQRLPTDAALRSAVLAWQERLLPLAALAEPVEPSPGLWRRIELSLDPVQAVAPRPKPTGWWQSLNLWRGLSATGFAAAAIMASVLLQREMAGPAAPGYLVVLVAPQSQAPGWVVQAVQGGTSGRAQQQIKLVPLGEPGRAAVPAEKSLQFWTKADGWSGPVSLGLVQPGQAIQILLDKLPPLQPNQLFELTLEPANGSPTGRPTGPIQFIGRAVQL